MFPPTAPRVFLGRTPPSMGTQQALRTPRDHARSCRQRHRGGEKRTQIGGLAQGSAAGSETRPLPLPLPREPFRDPRGHRAEATPACPLSLPASLPSPTARTQQPGLLALASHLQSLLKGWEGSQSILDKPSCLACSDTPPRGSPATGLGSNQLPPTAHRQRGSPKAVGGAGLQGTSCLGPLLSPPQRYREGELSPDLERADHLTGAKSANSTWKDTSAEGGFSGAAMEEHCSLFVQKTKVCKPIKPKKHPSARQKGSPAPPSSLSHPHPHRELRIGRNPTPCLPLKQHL